MTTDVKARDGGKATQTLSGEAGEKAPFCPRPRMKGRLFSKMPLAAGAKSLPPAGLPPLGAAMRRLSAKDAVRRFGKTLDAAQIDPLIIERHGKPCAVMMSIGQFRSYEAVLRERSFSLAAQSLFGAIDAAREGRLRLSARLRKEAHLLGLLADRRRT